jgi:hypothetical protein
VGEAAASNTTSHPESRVDWVKSEIGKKKRLATRLVAASRLLHCHKYGIHLGKRFGVIAFQDPTLLGGTVLEENAEVDRLRLIWTAPPSGLECDRLLYLGLMVRVVCIKIENFPRA